MEGLLAVVQQAQAVDQEAKATAIAHLEEAVKILRSGMVTGGMAAKKLHISPGRSFRPGYIKLITDVLRSKGQPLTPKEIVAEIREKPGMEGIKRESLEKRIFQDLRMRKPRLERYGKKGDGLYWIAGVDVPKAAKKKSA